MNVDSLRTRNGGILSPSCPSKDSSKQPVPTFTFSVDQALISGVIPVLIAYILSGSKPTIVDNIPRTASL